MWMNYLIYKTCHRLCHSSPMSCGFVCSVFLHEGYMSLSCLMQVWPFDVVWAVNYEQTWGMSLPGRSFKIQGILCLFSFFSAWQPAKFQIKDKVEPSYGWPVIYTIAWVRNTPSLLLAIEILQLPVNPANIAYPDWHRCKLQPFSMR